MSETLKQAKEKLEGEIKSRNNAILREVIEADGTLEEVGEQYGLSRERVKQIIAKKGVNARLRKGTGKWNRWRERISKAKTGKKYVRKNSKD